VSELITDHKYDDYNAGYPEYGPGPCAFIYMPDNPAHDDPSGGWMMGGPIECGGTEEQHATAEDNS
jgi:hypothetical protein